MFGGTKPFKIDKPIRLIELFGGISCQAQALMNLGIDFEEYRYCDFDKYACQSHNEIMGRNDKPSDITKWKGEDLGVCETDKYCYIMTYSFPCTDLSTAGKMAGMERGSGTRSGLLWEVERLLKDCNELPQVLLMENVPQVHGKKNKASFDEWCQFLESLGYKNYWKDLNAKDYDVPQSRNRCFMVSLLGDYSYEFPKPIELKLRLQDLLEDEVDEKYYLNDKMVKYIQEKNDKYTGNNGNNSVINRDIACTKTTREGQTRADASDYICKNIPNNYKLNQVAQINDNLKTQMCNKLIQEGKVKENDVIRHNYTTSKNGNCIQSNNESPTLDTRCDCLGVCKNYRIRKLTPTECLRLMGVRDEYIKKMTFKKEIVYLEGGTKCNAKLRIVKEKQRHLDTETYVLCTTNDILDMEMSTQTKWKKNIKEEKLENLQNVNFVIELLEEAGHLKCVTNIIKCGENMEMLYSLMKELDLHHTAIIELVQKDNENIGKFMKILLEENFPKTKLFIISTLIEQIIKSKIYTCIVQSANIQGNIAIIENCVKNSKIMKLLNLKMEYITRLNSDAMLYKQAGNGIVVDVLMAIFREML